MKAFARQSAIGRESPSGKARGLYDDLVAVMRAGNLVADRDNTPKAREPLTAAELWDQVVTGKQPPAGCYELTVLYIGMARSLGLAARGVEPLATTDSGAIGHVLVAVDFANGDVLNVDLQKHTFGIGAEVRRLTDAELAAHHVNHRAVAAILRDDPTTAANELRTVVDRVEVPQVDNNYATLMAREGRYDVAAKYARRAVMKAPKAAVYRFQLGHVLVDAGEVCAGLAELAEALRLRPGYPEVRALARRMLEANPKLSCAGSAGAP